MIQNTNGSLASIINNMKKILSVILVIIFLEAAILINNQISAGENIKATPNLQKYAKEVLDKCKDEKYKPSCYDREIPRLMDFISMEDAFKVTSIIQDEDKNYPYCHVLGHKLSAREIQKDPSKWKEAVTRCPSGVCSNGCIHGGFQERFRAENFTDEEIIKIKPDLTDLCEARGNWQPTGLEQGSCYHALGHLTMYLTSADINKATQLCEEVSLKKDGRNFSQLCFDGAFMQIYQPLEPEDFALTRGKEVKRETVDSFCANFDNKRKASCLSESWPLFGSEIQKPDGLVKFCSKEETHEQGRCFEGMLYVLTAQFNFDSQKIQQFCLGLPDSRQGGCFANSASRMIETDYRNIDKSVELCSGSQSDQNQAVCFAELLKYSTYNFHVGSDEFLKLCNSLPEGWKQKCLSKR